MDIMYYRLKKEGRFYLVSILDDYSRFIVAHKVCTTQTGDNITAVFHEAVDKYGLPNQLLTDRGSQFASWKGINAFYVEHYNYERVHMGIGYLVPADRFFNSERAVAETVEKAASEKTDFYLADKKPVPEKQPRTTPLKELSAALNMTLCYNHWGGVKLSSLLARNKIFYLSPATFNRIKKKLTGLVRKKRLRQQRLKTWSALSAARFMNITTSGRIRP